MEVFQDYAYYYNSFYEDKNYKKEAEQIVCLLKNYGSTLNEISEIINFGCGTGKHDIELSNMGYRCTGIDHSPLMIDIARKNAKEEQMEIDFRVTDIRDYMPEKQYDAVISLFHVISYQNKNEDIIKTLKNARKSLRKNGLFLFDVWYGPGVLSDKPSIRVKDIEDDNNRLIRIAKPVMHNETNIVDVHYEILVIDKKKSTVKTINEIHNMRYFFRPELEFMLNETGFEMLDNVDCNSLKATDYNSWTSYFIARAV